jgi:adenosylcobyric acid synthase
VTVTVPVPAPGAHGGDGARLAAALGLDVGAVLDLSVSLNPAAPDPGEVVAKHLDTLRRYPDPAPATRALEAAMAVDDGRVLLTNGGAEAITLVAAELGGHADHPDFSLYPTGGERRWRSNPHNPTGRLAPDGEVATVWDEAFYPLATGRWTRGDAERGAVVVGSLTKLLACPGLRVGYVLAPNRGLTERLAAAQPAWSLNSLAAAALPDLLAGVDLGGWARLVAEWRAALVELLRGHELEPEPSDANFVLVKAPDLRDRLAPHAVLVRSCASFGLPDHVRIAVPDPAGLTRLAHALATPPFSVRKAAKYGAVAHREPLGLGGPLRGALMVCGTASDVGKSHVVAGLCRVLRRRGVRVAPFKAQNMALNSFVAPDGGEIARAQAVQAQAAGVEPEVAMNPILLKPTGERTSQVVVRGRPGPHLDAAAYQREKPRLAGVVQESLDDLRSRFDVVVIEGAGSPAEINLLEHDIVNLGLAARAGVPAVVVADIDRGGAFAALYGTVALLPENLRATVRGFLVNKFRGDPALLGDAFEQLERRCGVPGLGVLPYLTDVALDAEDSLALAGTRPQPAGPALGDTIDVAAIRFPRLANFTDLDPLAMEPGVNVRLVQDPAGLGAPDLVVLPGTKATVDDLEWLRARGMDQALAGARAAGSVVLGVCGGYQMLGRAIDDPVESGRGRVEGLGWLDVETVFEAGKVTRRRRGTLLGRPVAGYQIHHGRVRRAGGATPWLHLDDVHGAEEEGARDAIGTVLGTTVHGLFEEDGARVAFLEEVARRGGKSFVASGWSFAAARERQIDCLADAVESHLDLDALTGLIAEGAMA